MVWSARPDSALFYGEQGLDLAEKLNFIPGKIAAQTNIGLAYTTIGNYPRALEYGFKALALSQRNNSNASILNIYTLFAISYREQGDYKSALRYSRDGLKLAEQLHSEDSSNWYLGMATIYEKNNQPDSAIYYAKKNMASSKSMASGVLYPLGSAYAKKKMYDSAIYYYRIGLAKAHENRTEKDVIDIYNGIAIVNKLQGKLDSAIFYAKKNLYENADRFYPSGLLKASSILTDVYQQQNKTDSTLKYLRLTINLKDSLFGREKTMAIQNLEFKEKENRKEIAASRLKQQNKLRIYGLLAGLFTTLLIAVILLRSNRHKQKAKIQIENAFTELKNTQAQLVQREKMASLGEVTAGIAHEIQNPLNFVNNFSDVNKELLTEMKDEMNKGNIDDANTIANDVIENEEKINHHGKRADAIVKGMLQHSQNSTGQKEPADINTLCDEYLRLSYNGLRAKDKTFNTVPATIGIKTDFDETIGKINIVPQDIGRVLLNLYNNAFYAVNERRKIVNQQKSENLISYKPTITVRTSLNPPLEGRKASVLITVSDNGNGIPEKNVDKIFQPFFTTKPTGQGTGLGLSLSYDIIKVHGGEIKVESKEGEGTKFMIQLPTI